MTSLLDLDREVLLPAYPVEPVRRCLPYIVVFVLGSKAEQTPRTAIDKKQLSFGVSRIVVQRKECGNYSSLKRKKKFCSSDGGNSIQILPLTTDRAPGGTVKGV